MEILVLSQQLSILQRKLHHPLRPNRIEKLTLATLTAKLKQIPHISNNQLRDVIRIFQPETVLRWHRELVRRKWTYPNKNKGGRPATNKELEKLILRLARENPRWGYGKIRGALVKLGFKVSQPTVRNILNRHGIQPAPVRNGSIGWRYLMAHYKDQILACDFFTGKPSCCRLFMCSSSSNWVLVRFILQASPPTLISSGLLNKPGSWFGDFRIEKNPCDS